MPAKGEFFMISAALNFVDVLIIAFFICLFIAWPYFFKNKPQTSDCDFLLMGKSLSLPLFVATLTSTWYGGILGVTQIAFEHGLYGFFTQGLFWYVAYFLFAIFLAKRVRKFKVLSLPELIGQKFGRNARKLSAIILFFHSLPITYAISIGLLLELIFNISFFWAIFLGVFTVAIYTSLGGFKGVVFTDCLQFILMFLAVILVMAFCLNDFGFVFLKEHVPASHFSLGEHRSQALIWLFIACTSTFIHPVFYQRTLAAKTDKTAMMGIFIAMLMWLIFDLCTCFGGMYARALFPHADSATAYLVLGVNILPHGLKGIFLVGVLATVLSTLDSFMFVCGSSISYDLIKPSINRHKIAILCSALLVTILGCLFSHNFEANWLFMEGAFSSTMLLPIIMSLWFKRDFLDHHFLLMAGSSLLVFCGTTYLKVDFLPSPFYCAHLTAFAIFLGLLKIKTQTNSQMALWKSN